ncbi:hypothetical protein AVEN_201560-1 [Araneus ventricosus]|uniref:Uncharacterized protein n=1 Tax=Araneus ventricosus TaxID=182803 RepID=A0A4Y2I4Y2_ARAVE|nr:hypothetical protein AVEN_201560-1 [Araneus ventricosus]
MGFCFAICRASRADAQFPYIECSWRLQVDQTAAIGSAVVDLSLIFVHKWMSGDEQCIATDDEIIELVKNYWEELEEKLKQYSAVLEELSKKIAAEDESDALYLDGEVTVYSELKTDSETDLENNPVHEEYRDSNSNTNVCIIHPVNL